MESYIKFLLLFITVVLISKSYAFESVSGTKVWGKPQAVIAPNTLEVVRGKNAIFNNLSKAESPVQLSLKLSNKNHTEINSNSDLIIDTSALALGKHAVTLTVTDDKGFSDSMSAILIVLDNPEEQQNKEDAAYFDNLAKEIEAHRNAPKNTQDELLLVNSGLLHPSPANTIDSKQVKESPREITTQKIITQQNTPTVQKTFVTKKEDNEPKDQNREKYPQGYLFFIFLCLTIAMVSLWYHRKSQKLHKTIITVNPHTQNTDNTADKEVQRLENPNAIFNSQIDMGEQKIFIVDDKE